MELLIEVIGYFATPDFLRVSEVKEKYQPGV
jgi:hypothetical protein